MRISATPSSPSSRLNMSELIPTRAQNGCHFGNTNSGRRRAYYLNPRALRQSMKGKIEAAIITWGS